MTKILSAMAFSLGALAVLWTAWGFLGTSFLALCITMVIGVVYIVGYFEILQFRNATRTLTVALNKVPRDIEGRSSKLNTWLNNVDPSIRNAVRARIEGERVGLPTPFITPYLVGLLVMLGLLGTFVGMVVSLQGAVLALEGTTELAGIKASLAAPIKGLGLAFGTSVAGVAASAMLGLLSVLSRRERLLVTRSLDNQIPLLFLGFSREKDQQNAFKALQNQAEALPQVVGKLDLMAKHFEKMGDQMGERLNDNQTAFHESVKTVYSDLAKSLDASLKDSITESGRVAAESGERMGDSVVNSIKPIMDDAVSNISRDLHAATKSTHDNLTQVTKDQLSALCIQFTGTSDSVKQAWQDGVSAHQQSNTELAEGLTQTLKEFASQNKNATDSSLQALETTAEKLLASQSENDNKRLASWSDALKQVQSESAEHLSESTKVFAMEMQKVATLQTQSTEILVEEYKALTTKLSEEWVQAGSQSKAQQEQVSTALQESAGTLVDSLKSSSTKMIEEIQGLLDGTEELVHTRKENEENWMVEHGVRMEDLTSTLKTELTALREDEDQRADAVLHQLTELQSTAAENLASLGRSLEEPMSNLIHSASDAPRAAAEVIEQLRGEMSKNIERDNELLEDRQQLMQQLTGLSESLQTSAQTQQEAVSEFVGSSSTMLKEMSGQLGKQLEGETSKLVEMSDGIAGSAIELSSLGEAFAVSVNLFKDSNQHLVDSLNRIEQAMDQSTVRSDEQLGYYVAQAREIIDHSILSQKELFEHLRLVLPEDSASLIAAANASEDIVTAKITEEKPKKRATKTTVSESATPKSSEAKSSEAKTSEAKSVEDGAAIEEKQAAGSVSEEASKDSSASNSSTNDRAKGKATVAKRKAKAKKKKASDKSAVSESSDKESAATVNTDEKLDVAEAK